MLKQKIPRGFVAKGNCPAAMSGASGPRALPRRHQGELLAKMPGPCVGPRRSRWRWGRRWGTGTSRGSGAKRQAKSSIRKTRCKSAERLQDCQRSRGKRQAAEPADAAAENEALGTPGTAGSIDAARDPQAVWVNGTVSEPEMVGPAGSVWVTRFAEEAADCSSPQGCERRGRPGTVRHESILELWLKVQAVRAASGCGVGSRVELHPVPAGEGPVERGLPGRASWIETSRGGVTGPWVRGQARAFPQVSGLSAATGVRSSCERALGSCGYRQAETVPPVFALGAVEELGCTTTPSPWERPQVVRQPESLEMKMDCGTASEQWGQRELLQVPGALSQEAVCGDNPGMWGRGQVAGNLDAMVVPRTVEEKTTSVSVPARWQRRQEVEDVSSECLPGVWGTGQPVGVPCVTTTEETRCGDDLKFRGKEQDMWLDSGSGGDPASWEAAQTVEPSGPREQEAASQLVPQGLWGIEQPRRVPMTLRKETDCVNVPGLWGPGQLPGVSQAAVIPEAGSEDTNYGGVPDLWERQQVLGTPAEAVEKTYSGNVQSLQAMRQAMEPEDLVPGALGAARSTDEEAGYGAVSCLCGRRQALGVSETVGMPRAASMARHKYSPVGVSTALGTLRSGRMPARVPDPVWVSGPVCQESSSGNVLNLWERAHTVKMPVDSRGAMAPGELWSVGEDTDSRAFPGSQGRRQAVRVPGAPEALGFLVAETDSRDFSGLPERRHPVEIPVTGGLPPAGGRHGAPRMGRSLWEGSGSCLNGERQIDDKSSTGIGVFSARMPGPMGQRPGSGCISALSGHRQTTRMSTTIGLSEPVVDETPCEGFLGLLGRRQTAGIPVAARLPMAPGVSASKVQGPQMVGESPSGDGSDTWRRRQVTEAPTAVQEGDIVSEGASVLWRRHDGPFPETARMPVPLGRGGAVGVPLAGHVPAAVWVNRSSGEADVGVPGLTAVSRQSMEGAEPSGEQTGDGGVQAVAGRGQAVEVSYTCGRGARLRSCARSVGQETAHENVSRVSGIRMAVVVPPVSREEIGPNHFRDHPQQSRRQVREVSGIRVRGSDLRDSCVGEDTLRRVF